MHRANRCLPVVLAVACALTVIVVTAQPISADQTVTNNGIPVITVRSNGGAITVFPSGSASVQILSGVSGIKVSHFPINQAARARIMLPGTQNRLFARRGWRTFRLAPRQFSVPNVNARNDGISIENPGGDLAIGVPKRLGALIINAQSGDVTVRKLRGPYVIVANEGTVRLQDVAGRGMIRTVSGNIDLNAVGGNIHIQTATGTVTARGSFAEQADVISQGGSIDWRFARVGSGAYRFRSADAPIRLRFRPGLAALIDAQSGQGSVQSTFDPASAQTRFSSAHALSIAVSGGGPEITAASMSGAITIELVNPSKP